MVMALMDTIYANASRAKREGVMLLVLSPEINTCVVGVSTHHILCTQKLSAQESGKSL